MNTLPSSAYVEAAVALPRDGRDQVVARCNGARCRCSAAGSSRCRRCSSPGPGSGTPGRTAPPAGRPAMPAMGTSWSPIAASCRRCRTTATTSGSIARGTSRRRRSSSSQSPVWMLKSSVRHALLASVQCTRPPVRFQTSHVSMVPKASSPRLAARARTGDVVEQPAELGAGEVGVEHEPGLAPRTSRRAPPRAARRTSARCAGPARRWRWRSAAGRAVPHDGRLALVGDADRGHVALRSTSRLRQRLVHHARLRRPDLVRVVLDPARLREDLAELLLRGRRTVPSRPNRMARELVVPWSRARTKGMFLLRWRSACRSVELHGYPVTAIAASVSALRERRTFLGASPALPKVPRERLHCRTVTFDGYQRDDGLFDIEAHLVDIKDHDFPLLTGVRPAGMPVHDMWVRVTIDRDFIIVDIEAATESMPYPGGCDRIGPAYKKLIGANLVDGFRKRLHDVMGHTKGCTHLTEMLVVSAHRRHPDLRRLAQARGRGRRQAVPARPLPCARDDHRHRAALLSEVVSRRTRDPLPMRRGPREDPRVPGQGDLPQVRRAGAARHSRVHRRRGGEGGASSSAARCGS